MFVDSLGYEHREEEFAIEQTVPVDGLNSIKCNIALFAPGQQKSHILEELHHKLGLQDYQ